MDRFTALLFVIPSFWEGMARTLDIGGTMTEFNRSPNPRVADALAMRADWMSVGQDLWNVLDQESLNGVESGSDVQAITTEEETDHEACPRVGSA